MTTIVIIVVAVVALIAVAVLGISLLGGKGDNGGGIGGNQNTERPTVITGINISIYPKVEYYVGESFDPTGLKVQLVSNNNQASSFVDASKLEISGFDSSVPNDAVVITVKYQEFTTQFTVRVKERPEDEPTVVGIKLSDNFQSTYTLQEWNSNNGPYLRGVRIILIYSDGSEETTDANVYTFCMDVERQLDAPGTTQFKVFYQGFETTITVTITE